jgi:hypothetical protein
MIGSFDLLDAISTRAHRLLSAAIVKHCGLGICRGKNPDFPIIGCGNDVLVERIVRRVIHTILQIGVEKSVIELKVQPHQTLAYFVAEATLTETGNKFHYQIASGVILDAGKAKLTERHLTVFSQNYPYEYHVLSFVPHDDDRSGGVAQRATPLIFFIG